MTVNSRTISQKPRVSRNVDSCPRVLPLRHHRNAPIPAVNMKTGAQKCVIQRVKKRTGVVCERSVGENDIAPR